jgi:hypothetical protein
MQPPTVALERPRTSTTLVSLTLIGLVGFGLSFIYFQLVISQSLNPVLIVYTVGSLLIAVSIARGWRWGHSSPRCGSHSFSLAAGALSARILPILRQCIPLYGKV